MDIPRGYTYLVYYTKWSRYRYHQTLKRTRAKHTGDTPTLPTLTEEQNAYVQRGVKDIGKYRDRSNKRYINRERERQNMRLAWLSRI